MGNKRSGGFTLIELLVVIAIIAILAGIAVAMIPRAMDRALVNNTMGGLKGLENGISQYQADHNQPPPDHGNGNYAVAPLFYELKGVVITNDNTTYFSKVITDHKLSASQYNNVFARPGILNAAHQTENVKDYYKNLKQEHYQEVPINGIAVNLATLPNDWSANMGTAPLSGTKANPWFYNMSNPTNNVGSYDLWGHLYIGGKMRIISNWRQ